MEVEKLSKAMTAIHAQMAEKATRDRKAAIQKHNYKTHVRSPNSQVGDYMLVAEHRKSGVSKLQVKWKGLRRVASVESDYVFVVGTLLSYGCGCSQYGGEVHGVARGHRRGARDAISLRVLMGKCYAFLRMRPLSISWAECSVVISCGKVDYDKSGQRGD
jgi:hypothetical protein